MKEKSTPLLYLKGIYKGFPGVQALTDVHLWLNRGEVLALVGENGAGKSTFMKILAGVYRMDKGKIYFRGKDVLYKNSCEALEAGISTVYQNLNLVDKSNVNEFYDPGSYF
ncbi:MAG: ATP-binding cassette domain-containing protein [Candidatus Aminicenantaceae bacterium]